MSVNADLQSLFALLDRLHRPKDRAYGDAWRKRGEVLGIFGNIARKYDRLAIAQDEVVSPTTESLGDTIADLCIYAAKYVTWLAERYPGEFDALELSRSASECEASRGPEALASVFAAVVDRGESFESFGTDRSAAWTGVTTAFIRLEGGLMAQAEGGPALTPAEKLEIALMLTIASARLLAHLWQADPSLVKGLRNDIEAMEARSE